MKKHKAFIYWLLLSVLVNCLFLSVSFAAIAPTVYGDSISKASGETPTTVKITIETSSSARGMKVLDDYGNTLLGASSSSTNEKGNKEWMFEAEIPKAYSGALRIYVKVDEDDWLPTDAIFDVSFANGDYVVQADTPPPTIAETQNEKEVVLFGRYEQGNGKESVEWLLLDIDYSKNKALSLSKYVMDMQRFNQKWTKVSWKKWNVRKWLNETFYKGCFSSEERTAIIRSDLESYHGDQYVETSDNIFFLSADEAREYFSSTNERRAEPTFYAIENEVALTGSNCYWWLRDASGRKNDANRVKPDGSIEEHGGNTNAYGVGVRPALWADLTYLDALRGK